MQNKLKYAFICAALAGCASIVTTFETGEYQNYVNLSAEIHTVQKECDDPVKVKSLMPGLVHSSDVLVTYTKNLKGNEESAKIAADIDDVINRTNIMYNATPPSPAYCKLKFTELDKIVTVAVKAIGSKEIK